VAQDPNAVPSIIRNRWLQLVVGILGMVAIANLQYGWTLFVSPIDSQFHWGKAAIQVAFTLFVLAETWLVPLEAYFVDRYGPRFIVASAESWSGSRGLSTRAPIRSLCFMPAALSVALAPVSSTARRVAPRSNGFLTGAA
jgi:MFS family permease